MNRRWMIGLAALFAGKAAAQRSQCIDEHGFGKKCTGDEGTWLGTGQYPQIVFRKPYQPDQCPVCGEMAAPYLIHLQGAARITRCKLCNCAFWQDAAE